MSIDEILAAPVDSYGWRVLDGKHIKLGAYVKLGIGVKLGNGVKLGDGVKLGNGVTLGIGVTEVIDLGHCEGWRKALACVDGVAYIAAGCRWFTLSEAVRHWADRGDRPLTRALMIAAVKIAEIKGWNHH